MSHAIDMVYEMLEMRNRLDNLLDNCKVLAEENHEHIQKIKTSTNFDELISQPEVLSKKFKLKDYQIIGMNWLVYMHRKNLNCILADEMGLGIFNLRTFKITDFFNCSICLLKGKTCQSISFLAYLFERNKKIFNLIVVPSSTVDNWSRELKMWLPQFKVEIYRGSLDERSELRREIRDKAKKNKINAILCSYK